MSGVGGIAIAVLVVLVLAAVVGGVVFFVYYAARARSGETESLPLRLQLRVYLYLLSIIGVALLVAGLSALVQAGLGAGVNEEFSYKAQDGGAASRGLLSAAGLGIPQPEQDGAERQETLERALDEGILNGISVTLVGVAVLGLHVWGRRRIERENERSSTLNRVYLVLLLVIFSVVAVTTLPSAILDTLRYSILDSNTAEVTPGGRLAIAVVTVPVWAYYLYATLQALRREEATAPAAGSG